MKKLLILLVLLGCGDHSPATSAGPATALGQTLRTTNLIVDSTSVLGTATITGGTATLSSATIGTVTATTITQGGTQVVSAAGAGLSLSAGTMSLLPGCSTNQVPQWNGTTWVCGNAGGGSNFITPLLQGGQFAFQTRIDNWNPTGIVTNTTIEMLASDNVGTLITGIDAVDNSFPLGTYRIICNANGPVDDGVIALSNEDSNSVASNRIWTPDTGHSSVSQAMISRFIIGPTECVPLVYIQPDQTDNTTKRWVVVSGGTRKTRVTTGSLQLFPALSPDPNLVTGTLNNWSPVDICPQVSGAHGGSCEAGSSTKFSDYTIIYVTTKDGTGATITGMQSNGRGDPSAQGPLKIILNKGPGALTIKSQNNGSSSGNQFNLPSNTDVTIGVGQSRMFWSDYVFWYPVGTTFSYSGSTNSLQCMSATNSLGNCLAGETDDGTTLTLVPGKFTVTEATGLVALAGKVTSTLSIDGDPLAITDNAAGRTTSTVHDINIVDNGSFDTTSGARTLFGLSIAATPTTSAGTNALNVTGFTVQATGCAHGGICNAITTGGGNVVFGSGAAVTFSTGLVTFGSGHIFTGGATPTITSCGTSPNGSVSGDDHAGLITTGGGASSCTVTWANTYGVSPVCVFQNDTGAAVTVASKSATQTVLTVGAAVVVDYICWSRDL